MATILTLSPGSSAGEYVLVEESGRSCGLLSADRGVRTGKMSGDWGSVDLHSVGRLRRKAAYAGDEGSPLIRLEPPTATAPDGTSLGWELLRHRREYTGTLTSEGASIVITVPVHGRTPARAAVWGDWPERDRLTLAACFAVLARRCGDRTVTAVAAAIGSSGSR
ncbi:hypothetical protein QR77_29135 [Streptomyces sp. 150FB]|uniref:hypothetical protein n=1 Tax=Streptomyces sp. 150FB TaxID=1576605 RepID=UPI000588E8CE|nr:hypothetical protein [Streptomyces sp. 150FB]KIF76827.1 hypothetical protein QR77_29135 [Streptomyces sp. 150FB]